MIKKRCARYLAAALLAVAFVACENEAFTKRLPYFGIHSVDRETGDSLFYTIPKFSLTNQDGQEISTKDYHGKPYVADFFFTTCPSICPIMSSQMVRLQNLVKDNGQSDKIAFLSHTIDPEQDTPEVLKEYANRMGADLSNWNFVTGDKSDIYYLAKEGYMVNALESDTAAGGYIHSDSFVLVDSQRHIRGYYDGTSTKEVDKLLEDIDTLLNEYTSQQN